MTNKISTAALMAGVSVLAVPALAADVNPMPDYVQPIYQAEPVVTGQVQLYGGIVDNDSSDSFGLVGGRGSVNLMLHNDIRTQLDLIAASTFNDGAGSDVVLGLAHFYKLNSGANAYGVFVGGGSVANYGTFLVGLEGQHFWGPITVGGDIFVGASEADGLWGVSAYLAYYISEQTKVQGRLGYVDMGSIDAFDISARLAHRFVGSAFGIFGEVGWTEADTGLGSGDAFRFLVGLNVDIDGGGSRLSHDRSNTLWTNSALTRF